MSPISFPFLSTCLLTFGGIIALYGVLSIKPIDVIDSSIIWSDGPGVIRALFTPSKISDYIQQRNKAVLGLTLVIIGFLVGLPWFKECNMSPKILSIFLLFIVFLILIVPAATRKKVLTGWNESKYQWFVKLLDEEEFNKKNEEWKERGQEMDNLKEVVFLGHLKNALNISVNTLTESPTFEDLNKFREAISADVKNRSIFYYFIRPGKLFWAYK